MRLWIYRFILLFLCSHVVFANYAQSKADLEKKRKQKLEEIDYTKKLIEETTEKQKQTIGYLMVLRRQIDTRQTLIRTIEKELHYLNDQIEANNDIVAALQKDMTNLKEEYASMVRFAYKNRNRYNKIGFIISAETFNQSFKRLKLLQNYSDYRKNQMRLIMETQISIEEKTQELLAAKKEKSELLNKENQEKVSLEEDQKNNATIVHKLKSKEAELKAQLKQKIKIAEELEKEIERIIKLEIEANKKAAASKYAPAPEVLRLSNEFAQNKTRLPWPVKRGVISEPFGEHEHPTLKGIYVNSNGVRIQTEKGAEAMAVFSGEVANVISIPGAGISVIVKHGEYFSVYSNLSKAHVKSGQKINTRDSVGIIRYNPNSGNTELDFQIWKNTSKLDPAYWLMPH
jgi:murein hydrolase activator